MPYLSWSTFHTEWRAFHPRAFSSFSLKRPFSSNASTFLISMHGKVRDLHLNDCTCFLRKSKILHSLPELQPSHSSSSLYFTVTSRTFLAAAAPKRCNGYRGLKSLLDVKWNIYIYLFQWLWVEWSGQDGWQKNNREYSVKFVENHEVRFILRQRLYDAVLLIYGLVPKLDSGRTCLNPLTFR